MASMVPVQLDQPLRERQPIPGLANPIGESSLRMNMSKMRGSTSSAMPMPGR
jgi:hypothetical protein